jgi:hypothetical protein
MVTSSPLLFQQPRTSCGIRTCRTALVFFCNRYGSQLEDPFEEPVSALLELEQSIFRQCVHLLIRPAVRVLEYEAKQPIDRLSIYEQTKRARTYRLLSLYSSSCPNISAMRIAFMGFPAACDSRNCKQALWREGTQSLSEMFMSPSTFFHVIVHSRLKFQYLSAYSRNLNGERLTEDKRTLRNHERWLRAPLSK